MQLKRLLRDDRGSTIIEFAILAPVIFSLMLGVLQIGLQMHDYNAVRSIAADTARYTIVEYQKSNKLVDQQIEDKATAIAVNAPYALNIDNLTVVVTRPATDITGTVKLNIQVTYVPNSVLNFIGVGSPTITVNRPVYLEP